MPESLSLLSRWRHSPTLVRVVPFFVFIALTGCQGLFGEETRYWVYLAKTVVGAALVWSVRPWVSEMRWKFSWAAVATGLLVFVIWVGLDRHYPKWGGSSPAWNPTSQFGWPSSVAAFFIAVRVLGSSLVVPPLEEVFFRSFVYRYLQKPDFESVPLNRFAWMPFLVTSALFAVEHYQWLAGLLCGMLYQMLVIRYNRLGDAMTAHAITNFLLGLWVVGKGAWQFW